MYIDSSDIRIPTPDEIRERRKNLWSRGKPPVDATKLYRVVVPCERRVVDLPRIPLIHRKIETRRDATMEIIKEVAAAHSLVVSDITGTSRLKPIVEARFDAIYRVATERPELSLSAIGRIFCRDHTTMLHALRIHAERNGLPPVVRS